MTMDDARRALQAALLRMEAALKVEGLGLPPVGAASANDLAARYNAAECLSEIEKVHAAGGRALSDDEARRLIMSPMNLGRPRVRARDPSKRGPKPRRTQYDDAFDLRRGLYHELVRLPENAAAGGEGNRRASQNLRDKILAVALAVDPTTPRHKLAKAVEDKMLRDRGQRASIVTIRRVLNAKEKLRR